MMPFKKDTVFVFIQTLFPELNENEAIFISLSARAKYLSSKEKTHYALGRNEMFHRKWFTGEEVAAEKVEQYLENVSVDHQSLSLRDFADKKGNHIPLHALSTYININPSDLRKATFQLQQEIQGMMLKELSGQEVDYTTIQSLLNTQVQKSRSRRLWTDIDMDFPVSPPRNDVIDQVLSLLPVSDTLILKTHSGYHLVVRNTALKEYKINLGEVIKDLNSIYPAATEIKINENAMVPLPGTLQGGTYVEWV